MIIQKVKKITVSIPEELYDILVKYNTFYSSFDTFVAEAILKKLESDGKA